MQLITFFIRIFEKEKIPVWVLSYTILSTSKNTGLIQLIPDSQSLDALKKGDQWPGSLRGHFEMSFGPPHSPQFRKALDAYIQSLAGYCVVTYLLAIKDRHNGNVMLDTTGRLIHIDFGFVFGFAPGKKFSMETAPWKLTVEMVDVMGGFGSPDYEKFVNLTADAFKAARKHAHEIVSLMEILSFNSNYPAFIYNPNSISDLKDRLMLHVADADVLSEVRKLMNTSYNHAGARRYDRFQVLTNGIAM